MITTVIFDLDGTLTDCNLELAKARVSQALSALSNKPYEDILAHMNHIHYRCNVESIYDRNQWWDEFEVTLSPQEKQELTHLYWESVMETTCIKPCAAYVLSELKKMGLLLVLLTDFDGKSFSKQKRIESLPILTYFDLVVIAGDDTEEPKPSPEPFIHILNTLDISPEQALMIGDKPTVDLVGAESLGMHTLLLKGEYGSQWEHAVDDLKGILPLVRSLQKNDQ